MPYFNTKAELRTHLKKGHDVFLEGYYADHQETYRDLVAHGQSPKTLMISCSDSRVAPSAILQTAPGEIFSVRNVGNLVPPYEHDVDYYHGVSSALEYGVKVLKVENIIIMGHAHCGAIKAAIDTENVVDRNQSEFIHHWVDIAQKAMKDPCCCKTSIKAGNRIPHEVEQASVVNSMHNLMTFPFIKAAVEAKELSISGLYFNIGTGELSVFDPASEGFVPL